MRCDLRLIRSVGPPNGLRIDCKAASHSDGDRGAVLAYLEAELREPRRRSSVDCSSRPTGRRANKRRFGNLLQELDCPVNERLELVSVCRNVPLGYRLCSPVKVEERLCTLLARHRPAYAMLFLRACSRHLPNVSSSPPSSGTSLLRSVRSSRRSPGEQPFGARLMPFDSM